MGRTLRGFESEFPYLGGRGDVSDAGIIDTEEAYGDQFGAIGEHVAAQMFGAYQRLPISAAAGQSLPSGFTRGSSGELVSSAVAPVLKGPHPAATALAAHAARTQGRQALVSRPHWVSKGDYAVSAPFFVESEAHFDRVAGELGRKHATTPLKMKHKSGSGPHYVFTRTPRDTRAQGKLYGYQVHTLRAP